MSIYDALDKVQPLDSTASLLICDLADGSPSYYGYASMNGTWMIKQLDLASGTMRYAMGFGDYITAWTGRAALTYTLPFQMA